MSMVYALIHEEDGIFGISFPDFPGVVSTAHAAEDVIRKGTEALAFHVRGMVEDGDALPTLRSLAELRSNKDFKADAKGAVLTLVPLDMPGKAVRLNISMDENLVTQVDRAAQAAGQTRSAFLADAARQRIRG